MIIGGEASASNGVGNTFQWAVHEVGVLSILVSEDDAERYHGAMR